MSLNLTSIEWVKNPDGTQGYTLNSKTGCLNHTPEGLCLGGMFPCYAYKLANGRLKPLYLANENTIMRFSDGYAPMKLKVTDPFYPRLWLERLRDIPSCRMFRGYPFEPDRKGIFLDDMSDWMGDYWLREWTEAELQMMRDNPHHRIYTLTKQPQNLIKFSPFPDNCYVGVTIPTIGNHLALFTSGFKGVQAKIKFFSLEPLLENIYLHPDDLKAYGIKWVIIGACTGTKKNLIELNKKYPELTLMPYGKKWTLQPPIKWVEEIVRACDRAGVPVFLKDNLKPIFHNFFSYWAVDETPQSKYRQEMPE